MPDDKISAADQAGAWGALKDLGRTLNPCRFSAVSLLLGCVVLLQGQIQDLLRATAEGLPHSGSTHIWLFAAVLLWGHTNWYFARVMLYFRFPDDPMSRSRRLQVLATWVPRALGVLPMVVFALSCLVAARPVAGTAMADTLHRSAIHAALLGAGFFTFVVGRRRVAKRIVKIPAEPHQQQDAQLAGLGVGTWVYLGIWLTFGFVLLATFWLNAPATAPRLGPLPLVLLTASFWVPLWSVAVYLGRRFEKPVISLLVLAWIAISPTTDNHRVRTSDAQHFSRPAEQDFSAWLASLPSAAPGRNESVPIFFAAAEGGGLRAAYWTAKVLGGLTDDTPAFADHLFAVSSVSGGSVGAAVFDALLAERLSGHLDVSRRFIDQAKGVLGEDFLSPLLAAMLYPDALSHFVPGGARLTSADRGRALEASLELSWLKHVGTGRFAAPFGALWTGAPFARLPRLLLNTTCAETGRRFIVSPLAAEPPSGRAIGDVRDALEALGADVPLSTAAHLSARFPYVSPGGRVMAHPDMCGHFVDGGYFENSGTATLLDLLQALGPEELSNQPRRWVPVVVSINNDPARNPPVAPASFLSELLIPIETLLGTRAARGESAELSLLRYVTGDTRSVSRPEGCRSFGSDEQGYYFEFALSSACAPAQPDPTSASATARQEQVPVPLGWILSGAAQSQMDCQWSERSCADVRAQIADLLARR
jgi:hypothetical protein